MTAITTKSILRVDNLFSPEELQTIAQVFNNLPDQPEDLANPLGRAKVSIEDSDVPKHIETKLTDLVTAAFNIDSEIEMALPPMFVEYSNKYGQPQLPPHFDGDYNDLIIDYQLASNTSWSLGVDTSTYQLEDNSALIFNPNAYAHWRPRKAFKGGEYVRMVFFRFSSPINTSDYSYLPNHPDDPAFDEVNKVRDSLGS